MGLFCTSLSSSPFLAGCNRFCKFSSTDGTDHEDSECPDPTGRCRVSESRWVELCSSGSLCSQSSDDDVKPTAHSRVQLYPAGGDAREYPARMCSLLHHSGASAGRGPTLDLGEPPFPGILHSVSLTSGWRC